MNKRIKWYFIDDRLCNNDKSMYISCNLKNKLYITNDKYKSIIIKYEDNQLIYYENELLYNFKKTNISHENIFQVKKGINVGILLSAGYGHRFNKDIPKQLCILENKYIIEYSVEAMKNLDILIIITNSSCYDQTKKIIDNESIIILTNDVNDRLESIGVGLQYIKTIKNVKNIIIHDSARPFINTNHISNLINEMNDNIYSQYAIKITGGLFNLYNNLSNRDDFVELCSPLCVDYNYCMFIFDNYIKNRISYEFINIIHIIDKKYKILYDNCISLRKITYKNDL